MKAATIIDGKYEIQEFIGRGGMCSVYRARHLQLDKTIAIKVLHDTVSSNPTGAKRFQNESHTLSTLSHPNLIAAYGFGIHDNHPYMALELLKGRSLADVLSQDGPLPADLCVAYMTQVCDGLAYLHENNVVHRDLKPSNVMLLENGQIKIVDFGIAKLLSDEGKEVQKLTQTGQIIGTLLYISPEQCQGSPADKRSDIYSLGCMMFELLDGRSPFIGDAPFAVIYRHTDGEPEESTRLGPFADLIYRCIARDPDARPQSITEVHQGLLYPRKTPKASRSRTSQKVVALSPSARRTATGPLLVGAAVVAIGAACAVFTWSSNHSQKVSSESQRLAAAVLEDASSYMKQSDKVIADASRPRSIEIRKQLDAAINTIDPKQEDLYARLLAYALYFDIKQDKHAGQTHAQRFAKVQDPGGRLDTVYVEALLHLSNESIGDFQESGSYANRAYNYARSCVATSKERTRYLYKALMCMGETLIYHRMYKEAAENYSRILDERLETEDKHEWILESVANSQKFASEDPKSSPEQQLGFARDAVKTYSLLSAEYYAKYPAAATRRDQNLERLRLAKSTK